MKTNTYNWQFSSFSVIIFFLLLTLVGIAFIPLLNIELSPSRTQPTLTITYNWADASARAVEQEITSKLEGLFSSMTEVKNISSVSSKGSGRIEISFKKTASLDAVRFEIATLVRRAFPELPENVTYPTISVGTGGRKKSVLMTYTLSASTNPYEIQHYAEENIVPELAVIKGVNDINVYGATPFEFEITFDASKMLNLKIRADELTEAVNNYFRKSIIGIGYEYGSDNSPKQMQVALQNDISTKFLWDRLPVKKTGDQIIYLTDVAKVTYHEQIPNGYFRINGRNTINMIIYSETGVNNIKTARYVKDKMRSVYRKLPVDYSILLAYDTTDYIIKDLRTIAFRTLFSLLFLLTFVLVISRRLRYLAIIILSITVNLIVAVIFYYILKLEIHLYSLAGITVSFGMVIDSSIVMIDHLRHNRDKKVFLAILAATLTTMGSLCVIFFLGEEQKINLVDFSWVMIVNLGISLFTALFFIPALLDKMPLSRKINSIFFRRKRRIVKFNTFYANTIMFTKRRKWVFVFLFVLGFGIPFHWLPEKIDKENLWGKLYNKSIGNSTFSSSIRPVFEKIVGGSLRLFSENVFESSFYADPERTRLYVNGNMPEGCTIQQLNVAMEKIENYLSLFDEIDMFQTSVNSYKDASINISFKPEYENGSFPFYLKELLTAKAINLGGLDWSIYGVGQGFSNALYSGFKSNRIILGGYNYDQLYLYAELLGKKLGENPRVRDIEITGSDDWNISPLHEYYLEFNHEAFALHNVSISEYYSSLQNKVFRRPAGYVFNGKENIPLTIVSEEADKYDVWRFKNEPVNIHDNITKLSAFGSINKRKTGNDIHKYNQQYRLTVAYDFIGSVKLAEKVMQKHIDEINYILPLGYKADNYRWYFWERSSKKQYYLILLVILIIYFICSILLESFLQPLAVISLIPFSFIGLFLTFYIFGFNFDQGGFAAFILLSGLSVNSGLYVLNDYNNFKNKNNAKDKLSVYIKAYNHKIIPVIFTIISTVLGLVPFVIGRQKEVFWFAFAAGSIGGLIFSMLALFIYFPLFLRLNKKYDEND